jgi:hypothetical protein
MHVTRAVCNYRVKTECGENWSHSATKGEIRQTNSRWTAGRTAFCSGLLQKLIVT